MTSFWLGFTAGVFTATAIIAGILVLIAGLSYTRAQAPLPLIWPRDP